MDFLTQQFTAAVNKLNRVIAQVRILLLSQQDSLDKHAKAVDETTKASSEYKATTDVLLAKLDSRGSIQSDNVLRKKETTPYEWIVLAVHVITAIVVAAYTILAAYQLVANNRAAVAAENAANEAKRSNDALQSAQRGIVAFRGMNADLMDQGTSKQPEMIINFSSTWENVGNTPAFSSTYTQVRELKAEPSEDVFIGPRQPTSNYFSVLQPRTPIDSGAIRKPARFLFKSDHIDTTAKMQVFTRTIFVWGWSSYRDVFPNSEIHITEFCQQIDSIAFRDRFNPYTMYVGWKTCRTHNCIDKYCPDYQAIAKLGPQ
jgi:hypothetical protein